MTGFDPGDHVAFDPVSLGGVGTVTLRHSRGSAATAGTARATVELRLDSPTGPVLATATLNATTVNKAWTSTAAPVGQPAGQRRRVSRTTGARRRCRILS
ncbi:carbohydrate-binding protein [Dactylosporangium siamense]|uniref:carbohydrate-binding protein n=1 Tax=Dactylosporangium siamense TaxID=685454 RepID=UPI001944FE69